MQRFCDALETRKRVFGFRLPSGQWIPRFSPTGRPDLADVFMSEYACQLAAEEAWRPLILEMARRAERQRRLEELRRLRSRAVMCSPVQGVWEGESVRQFASISDAAQAMGVIRSVISEALRRRGHSCGLWWRYIDPEAWTRYKTTPEPVRMSPFADVWEGPDVLEYASVHAAAKQLHWSRGAICEAIRNRSRVHGHWVRYVAKLDQPWQPKKTWPASRREVAA